MPVDTYEELCGTILGKIDILEVIELLMISAEDLLERFEDRVMMNQSEIEEYLDESLR